MRYITITALLFCLFISATELIAQEQFMMTNSKPIDAKRYDGINGSPYIWETSQKVKVYPINDEEFEQLDGNYNMYEGEFEIYRNGNFIELPKIQYPKIILEGGDQELTFISSPVGIKSNYCIQHYADQSIRILEDRRRIMSKVTVQTPGDTQNIDKFKKDKDFYILKAGQLIKIDPSKKKIIKKFGHKKEIKQFIKSNSLKLKNIKDLTALITHMDKQGWIK